MADKPLSLPEKEESFKKAGYLEHWMFVWELKKLLENLKDSDWITPNEVHNLAISRTEKLRSGQIGYIDFLENKIHFDDGKEINISPSNQEEKNVSKKINKNCN